MERFVHVILPKLGPFALTLSLVYIPFAVRFMCIVYVVYVGTVELTVKLSLYALHILLIVKISFILFARCVYAYCLHFTFHIYLNTISYQVAAGQITWAGKGLLLVNFTFLCLF